MSTTTTPPVSAQFNLFPSAATPVINPDGTMAMPWYRFLQGIWGQINRQTPMSITIDSVNDKADKALAALGVVSFDGQATTAGGPSGYLNITVNNQHFKIQLYVP